ncbi:MAG: HAD family hydrolase [Anaerolineae bacterium]
MSRKNKRIEAVLFDLDDTILDWSNRSESWGDVAREHVGKVCEFLATEGHAVPDKDAFVARYQEIVVQSWDEAKKTWAAVRFRDVLHQTFDAFGLDVTRIDFDVVMRVYDWRPVRGVVPFEDAIPVLQSLRRQGYKIGLVTNSMTPVWIREIELKEFGLMEFFDVRISSGDTGYMKPHPAIYQRALALLNTSPERAVFVGDRPGNDIAGANNAGLVSVLMDPPHLAHELNGVRPDFTITRLCELLPILEQLESDLQK